MCALRIAAARPEDALEVAALHVQSWQAAYAGILAAEYLAQLSAERRMAQWRDLIERGSPALALAWEDGPGADATGPSGSKGPPQPPIPPHALGFVSYGACRDADLPASWGEICAIYLRPSHWSRGIGQALWRHACEGLRHQGFQQVCVWVLADNERAIRFYRRAGLLPDGVTQTIERGGQALSEVRYGAALC